jgi:hypothetical protein
MEETINFDKALLELTEIVNSYTFDVWIPSLDRSVLFQEINAAQQKQILTGSMDTSIYSKKFNSALFDIIKTNCSEDISLFTVLDKVVICLQLKEKISKILKISSKKNENVKIDVDLESIIKDLKTNYKHPKLVELINNNISAKVYPSTILEEKNYDDDIVKDNKKAEDIKSTDDIQAVVSDAFIGELAKTIKFLKIKDQNIDLTALTFKQRIRIVEKLPASLIQNILTVLSDWKKNLDSFLTVKDENESLQIKIDPLFFIG